jgi:predicted acylesterase/phospholipase RssA
MTLSGAPDALVLQGGGCRCFFTLGFLEAAAPRLTQVREIAAVSASSAMACAHALSAHRVALRRFAQLVRRNPRNFYPRRLLRGARPTPHHDMYRRALAEVLGAQADLFTRLRAGPSVRILVGTGPSRVLAVGLAVLSVLRNRAPRWLRTQVVDLSTLSRKEEIIDTVLASSAFPPFTPVPVRPDRSALIDGGAVDPIPYSALSRAARPRRTLVVLTRPTPVRPPPPDLSGLTFVAPEHPLGVSTWQYADEPALRRAYEHGLRVGARFLEAEERGQGRGSDHE